MLQPGTYNPLLSGFLPGENLDCRLTPDVVLVWEPWALPADRSSPNSDDRQLESSTIQRERAIHASGKFAMPSIWAATPG